MIAGSQPILSCEESRGLESRLFGGDEAKEWPAMQRAGRAVAAAVLKDFAEIGGFPSHGRVRVLVGKGHNGGDALLATQAILERFPAAQAEVVFVFGERMLRPLAARAWRQLVHEAGARVRRAVVADSPCDLCLDGVFGFQFRPPVEPRVAELLAKINAMPCRLRAAVDLPSAGLFHADFTYATGIVKSPVVAAPEAGRVRYLDLGFFESGAPGAARVLTPAVLAPLAALRNSESDKRTFGHVFVVAGSRSFPGAALMTVLAALRSGAGLVTAFVPETLVPAFAARAPEAMWVGWPETPEGGLALEGQHLLTTRIGRAAALVIGPGLGREAETQALVRDVVATARVPLVIDADALQPEIVRAGSAPRVLTPHAGEFARIAEVTSERAVLVRKGPVTHVSFGAEVYHSFFGGPVLARGGSGDILAGLIGGLLAQTPGDPLLAAARGVVWHGMAADTLARAHGQTALVTTQVLDFLGEALRDCANDE
jgi:ADP-dependent NAD(P)H-hydrate dehydratase / NAD(P)H-hydrate epimerase